MYFGKKKSIFKALPICRAKIISILENLKAGYNQIID